MPTLTFGLPAWSPSFLAAVVWTGFCLGALLMSERRGWRRGVWLSKPLASAGFIAAAGVVGALDSVYGRWILVALTLSWLGDVLLLSRGSGRSFVAGLISFGLAHLAFASAFLLREVDLRWGAGAAVAVGGAAWVVLRGLRPQLPGAMRPAVYAYVFVISTMLVCAAATRADPHGGTILSGAAMFWLSDLAVARERFVASTFWNRAWGLPLYYGAQLVLASSAA